MTGSLQVKNGKFYMVLNTYENGKRKVKWIATGLDERGNKRKAEQMLRETLLTYEPQKPSAEMLFADCVRQWLTVIVRKVDTVTYQGYEVLANTHILPHFDGNRLKLREITAATLHNPFSMKRQQMAARTAKGDCPRHLCDGSKTSSTKRSTRQ